MLTEHFTLGGVFVQAQCTSSFGDQDVKIANISAIRHVNLMSKILQHVLKTTVKTEPIVSLAQM